jgi:hypothetical protein
MAPNANRLPVTTPLTLAEVVSWIAWRACFTAAEFAAAHGLADARQWLAMVERQYAEEVAKIGEEALQAAHEAGRLDRDRAIAAARGDNAAELAAMLTHGEWRGEQDLFAAVQSASGMRERSRLLVQAGEAARDDLAAAAQVEVGTPAFDAALNDAVAALGQAIREKKLTAWVKAAPGDLDWQPMPDRWLWEDSLMDVACDQLRRPSPTPLAKIFAPENKQGVRTFHAVRFDRAPVVALWKPRGIRPDERPPISRAVLAQWWQTYVKQHTESGTVPTREEAMAAVRGQFPGRKSPTRSALKALRESEATPRDWREPGRRPAAKSKRAGR